MTIAVLATYATAITNSLSLDVLVSFVAVLAVGLVVWAACIGKRGFDVVDPANLIAAIVVVGFLGNLPTLGERTWLAQETMDKTAFGTAVTLLGLWLGARSGLARRTADRIPVARMLAQEIPRLSRWMLGTLWLGTVAFRLKFLIGRGVGSAVLLSDVRTPYESMVQSIGGLGQYLLIALLVLVLYGNWPRARAVWVGLVVGVTVEVLFGAVGGWKSAPLLALIAAGVWLRRRGEESKNLWAPSAVALLLVGAVLVLAFAAVGNYRAKAFNRGPSLDLLAESLAGLQAQGVDQSLSQIRDRTNYAAMFAVALDAVDRGVIEREWGGTIWPGLVWFVPRALWPSKPSLSIGGWYAVQVLDWRPGEGEAAITVPGDLYLNFGMAGVFLGMVCVGFGLRVLQEYHFRKLPRANGLILFMPILLAWTVGFERNVAAVLGLASQTYLLVAGVLWLSSKRWASPRTLTTE